LAVEKCIFPTIQGVGREAAGWAERSLDGIALRISGYLIFDCGRLRLAISSGVGGDQNLTIERSALNVRLERD